MKAYTLHGINDLRYEDVAYPECPSGWCIIKVRCAGICSSDIPRIFTKGTYHFPTIPGHEVSGVVDKVGDQENKSLLGKKVAVFPLIPCKECDQCAKGHYEMCCNYDYIGSRRNGGFAEYVAVPVWNLLELPDNISFEEAAMMEPLAVALHAVKQAQLEHGDSIAIVGTGMIGFAAVQWAKMAGVKAVILGRSNLKRNLAEKILGVEYHTADTCVDNFDTVVEAVGSNESIDSAINLVKPGGKVILIGNPDKDITLTQNTYWRILRKQLKLLGSWNSSYKSGEMCDWIEVREALANQKVKVSNLISYRFFQNELIKALNLIYEHKQSYCKVMTLWNYENEG